MLIIGCDFHTRYQQIAMAREETSESLVERRLDHQSGEAHAFYRSLQDLHEPVRVGIEATGPIHWFERLPGAPGSAFLPGCRSYGRGISSLFADGPNRPFFDFAFAQRRRLRKRSLTQRIETCITHTCKEHTGAQLCSARCFSSRPS